MATKNSDEKEDPLTNSAETPKTSLNDSQEELSPHEYKRLLWKIDRNIIPYVSLLYLVSQ